MSEIRTLAQHRWQDIYRALGLPEQILTGRHQSCIFCGGKDRARLTDYMGYGTYWCNQCCDGGIDGFEVLMRFTGKEFKEVAADVRSVIGETRAMPPRGTDVGKAKRKLNAMWQEAQPLQKGDPVHRYLLGRGLRGLSFGDVRDLRYHPALTYWNRDDNGQPVKGGEYPAMLGLVRTPTGEAATVHVTYLQRDGSKAPVESVRKLMTPVMPWDGGAVRLGNPADDQVLCVAEGIETALSMKLMHPEWCAWACISAGMLEKFTPPAGAECVYIAGDNDRSFTGQASAFALAKRITQMLGEGRAVVLLPEKQGQDFLDELIANRNREVAA